MNRSLVLPALILLSGLVGCRAQEDRKTLQNSVTKLEQRLTRMDDYLKSLQQGQTQEKEAQQDALKKREEEVTKLRELLTQHERAAKEMAQATEKANTNLVKSMKDAQQKLANDQEQARRELDTATLQAKRQLDEARAQAKKQSESERAAMQAELNAARDQARRQEAAARQQSEKGHAEAKAREEQTRAMAAHLKATQQEVEKRASDQQDARRSLEAAKQELEAMRAQLTKAAAAGNRRGDDRMQAIERLTAERREVQALRRAVQEDISRATQDQNQDRARSEQDGEKREREMNKLREENERLRNQLETMTRDAVRAQASAAAIKTDRKPEGGVHAFTMAAPKFVAAADAPHPPAPKPPATPTMPHAAGGNPMVVNIEGSEVHFHFHGNNAPVIHTTAKPSSPAAMSVPVLPPATQLKLSAPATLDNVAPRSVRVRSAELDARPALRVRTGDGEPPAEKPKVEKLKVEKKSEKKINDEELLDSVVQILMGCF